MPSRPLQPAQKATPPTAKEALWNGNSLRTLPAFVDIPAQSGTKGIF
jgi:hypothetical protein